MTRMADRKQDLPCTNFLGFGDQYNLQSGTEEASEYSNHYSSDNGSPKVLTTMRNMFSTHKNYEYELVYDTPSSSQSRPVQFVMPNHSNMLDPSHHQNHHQNPQTSQNHPNIQELPHHHNTQDHHEQIQGFEENTGPPGMEDEEDHEEDEDEVMEEEEDIEKIRAVHHCPHCSKKYTSERRLKHHIETHKNPDAYKCPKCGYSYQSPDSLRRHWKKTPNCDETVPTKNFGKTEQMDSVSS